VELNWPFPYPILRQVGDNLTRPLHCACAKGRVGAMRLLVELGADVEVQAGDGARPLHLSAMFGHVEAIKVRTRARYDKARYVKCDIASI
jgi:ankyrin repeat protein